MVVKSLEQLLHDSVRRFRSFYEDRQRLITELICLEQAIAACPYQDPAKCAWLRWANWKIRTTNQELERIQLRMEREQAYNMELRSRYEANAPAIKAEAARAFRATMTAITGPKIVKGKNRRYVAKGERPKHTAAKSGKQGHQQDAKTKPGSRGHQHGNRQAA